MKTPDPIMGPDEGKCPECCTELVPLFSSMYCPVCEDEPDQGWFEVEVERDKYPPSSLDQLLKEWHDELYGGQG